MCVRRTLEEVANAIASYRWWELSNSPINHLTWPQYLRLAASGTVSYTFWANVFSFVGSGFYVLATGLAVFRRVPTKLFYNSNEFVDQWGGSTVYPPPYEAGWAAPDVGTLQGLGDVCYFIDSVLFIWVSWYNFDIQVCVHLWGACVCI